MKGTELGLKLELQFELVLRHPALGIEEAEARLFLTKKRGESLEHVLLKLLGYVLFYHPDLEVEATAEQHYKPDLVRLDERGEPVQWIDCGTTSLRKLDRIAARNRRTTIDILKPSGRELELFKRAADARIAHPERVRYFSFRDGFLAELSEHVRSRHRIEAEIEGEHQVLRMSIDGVDLSTPIIRL